MTRGTMTRDTRDTNLVSDEPHDVPRVGVAAGQQTQGQGGHLAVAPRLNREQIFSIKTFKEIK